MRKYNLTALVALTFMNSAGYGSSETPDLPGTYTTTDDAIITTVMGGAAGGLPFQQMILLHSLHPLCHMK